MLTPLRRAALAFLLPLLLAGAAPPVPFVRHQYWQILPGVQWVYVDAAGTPWFRLRGGDVAASYNRPVKTVAPEQKMLLGDRKGRIWVSSNSNLTEARFFDGKKWHATKIKAQQAFGDSAGRAYLRDDLRIHVFAEGKWSSQVVFPKSSYAQGHFIEDARGRVWFWASRVPKTHWGEAAGTEGAWSFDGNRWTQHTTKTGFPGDDIHRLAPLRDGRLLVLPITTPYQADLDRARFWGPPAKTERFLEGYTATRLGFRGFDLDGNLYLVAGSLAKKGERTDRQHTDIALSPAGKVSFLTPQQVERLGRFPHASSGEGSLIVGRLRDEPPPCPRDPAKALCRDGAGRIYFVGIRGSSYEVGVLWPAQERPGDVLRLRQDPGWIFGRFHIFRGPNNALWAEREVRDARGPGGKRPTPLLRRTDKGWEETPVRILPHPAWSARPAAPWNPWSQFTPPRYIPGAGGSLLAIVVRDVYQDALGQSPPRKADPFATEWEVVRLGREMAKKRGQEVWLEGWLLRGGRATGPMTLEKLLVAERAGLAARFPGQSWEGGTADIQVEGGRVWIAGAGKVHVAEGAVVRSWPIPAFEERYWPLLPVNLAPMPGGGVVCCSPKKGGYRLHALSLKGGAIVDRALPEPRELRGYFTHVPQLLLTRDKQLWLWAHNGHGWRYTGTGWEAWPKVGRPVHEEADGSVWCLTADRSNPWKPGYWVLRGKGVVPGPDELIGGELNPTPDGELLCVSGRWLLTLGRAADPAKRPVIRRQILSHGQGAGSAFRDNQGNLLIAGGWIVPGAR